MLASIISQNFIFYKLVTKNTIPLLRSSVAAFVSTSSESAERKKIQLCFFKANKTAQAGALALETRAPSRKLCHDTLKGYRVRATSRRSAFSLLCGNFSEPASRRQGSRRAIFAGSTLASQKLALDILADSSQNTASSEKQKNSRHRAVSMHCFAFARVVF